MKLLLDTANLADIRYFHTYYPIAGVTTNPTILAREGGDVLFRLREIRSIIGDKMELHVQVMESEYEKILEEAEAIVKFLGTKENTFIKIPATPVGLRATRELASRGYGITVTAILSAGQALVAANAGASYVAPYVSRLENISSNGVETVSEIQAVFDAGAYKTEVLAASFKTAREVLEIALTGAGAATVSPDVMKYMMAHTNTDTSIITFHNDWGRAFGGRSILDFLHDQGS